MADIGRIYTYDIDIKFHFKDVKNEEVIVPSMYLTKGTKRFNYLTNFHPVWEGSCFINIKYLEPMRINQDKIYAILNITRHCKIANGLFEDAYTETIYTHRFIPFFTEDSFPNYTKTEDLVPIDSNEAKSRTSSNMATSLNHEVSFALYSEDALNFNKVLVNFTAKECDVGTALKYTIHHAQKTNNIKPKVIIDSPSNNEKYSFITVPSMTPSMVFRWLQVRYGIYDSGLSIFYDTPNLYILNRFARKHDYKEGSINKIILEIYTNPSVIQMPTAAIIKENTVTIKISQIPVKVDKDIFFSELMGNEVMYSNYTFASHAIEREQGEYKKYNVPYNSIVKPSNKHVKSQSKMLVDYDELNNPINLQSFLKTSSLHSVVSIPTIANVPIEVIKPNVIVQIKIMDDINKDYELAGMYTIASGDIVFGVSDGDKKNFIANLNDLTLIRIDQ